MSAQLEIELASRAARDALGIVKREVIEWIFLMRSTGEDWRDSFVLLTSTAEAVRNLVRRYLEHHLHEQHASDAYATNFLEDVDKLLEQARSHYNEALVASEREKGEKK